MARAVRPPRGAEKTAPTRKQRASDLRYERPTSAELERWLAEHAPDAQARTGATIDVPAGWIPVALSALEQLLDARESRHRPCAVTLRAMRTGTDGRLFVDVVHGNERNRGTVAGARALSAEICAQCGCAGDPVESPDGSRTTLCAGCRSQAHTPLARDWPVEATPDHPHAISPGQWTQDLRGPGVGVDWDAHDWRNYGKLETLYAEPIARLMRADDDAAAMRLWAGGPGWAPLVRALFTALRPEQEERPGEPGHTPWRLRWMKEKFGTLHVRTCRTTEYQLGVQFVIELQSHKTCMRCSAPGGVTSDGGWYVTLCDGCRNDPARKRGPTPEDADG